MHFNAQRQGENVAVDAQRGARLAEERKRLDMTQQAIADAVGIRREMWARYEAGAEPGADTTGRMAQVGVDLSYVLTGKTQMERAREFVANAIPPAMQKDVDRTLAMTRQRLAQTRASAANQPAEPPSEKLLLASYRRCTLEDKKRVVDFAVRLAKP